MFIISGIRAVRITGFPLEVLHKQTAAWRETCRKTNILRFSIGYTFFFDVLIFQSGVLTKAVLIVWEI